MNRVELKTHFVYLHHQSINQAIIINKMIYCRFHLYVHIKIIILRIDKGT